MALRTDNLEYHVGDQFPEIQPTLMRAGVAMSLVGVVGVTAALYLRGAEEASPVDTPTVVVTDAPNGEVTLTPGAGTFATAGDYSLVFRIEWTAGKFETLPDPGYIGVVVHERG
jgi:hypothetical protein